MGPAVVRCICWSKHRLPAQHTCWVSMTGRSRFNLEIRAVVPPRGLRLVGLMIDGVKNQNTQTSTNKTAQKCSQQQNSKTAKQPRSAQHTGHATAQARNSRLLRSDQPEPRRSAQVFTQRPGRLSKPALRTVLAVRGPHPPGTRTRTTTTTTSPRQPRGHM